MDEVKTIIELLNNLSPLGVLAFIGVIVLSITHKNGPVKVFMNNHLAHLQASMDRLVIATELLVKSNDDNGEKLDTIRDDISFLKGKMDNRF